MSRHGGLTELIAHRSKSGAASGLCSWVVNICKYFRIYQVVAPKRAALAEANKKLEGANKKLAGLSDLAVMRSYSWMSLTVCRHSSESQRVE